MAATTWWEASSHADGRRAVLLSNYQFAYSAWPTVGFDADAKQVVEVSRETGKEISSNR
jgi:hypothetical protein